ncbi:MAG: ATP-binding protein [Prolixibacteraceae bacterium]|nr:ATP-binding protein [Prolixibacteraceae bacterium]
MNNEIIERSIEPKIIDRLSPGHVVGLLGARRVGKTFLLNSIKTKLADHNILVVQGDNLDAAEILSSHRISLLSRFVKGYDTLFIDEAQMIPDIGANLKLMVDNLPNLSIFVTGSSAFDIRNNMGAPLTGRSTFYNLFAFAQAELKQDFITAQSTLHQKLIYGSYPQSYLAQTDDERISVLENIRDGYLLKDLLMLDNVKGAGFVINLLRLIAFQIGNEVSYSELGRALKADNKTVQRYLELLEKMYVLFSLNGFSRNMRKEYTKSPRYYFWDNGIRNVVISNFNPLNLRDDVGRLWENYCISERLKRNHYTQNRAGSFFWRTYDQKEVDYIEEQNNSIVGYEMKWTAHKSAGAKAFITAYENAVVHVVNQENFQDFLE